MDKSVNCVARKCNIGEKDYLIFLINFFEKPEHGHARGLIAQLPGAMYYIQFNPNS